MVSQYGMDMRTVLGFSISMRVDLSVGSLRSLRSLRSSVAFRRDWRSRGDDR